MWSVKTVFWEDLSNALVLYTLFANSSSITQMLPDKIPYSTKHGAGLVLWADKFLSVELSNFLSLGELTRTKLDFER